MVNKEKVIVGLTGGIGCGKSTVADMFREEGIPVIDADRISQVLMRPGSQVERAVMEHFGDAVAENGHVHRRKCGGVIFNDPVARRWVMDMMAPHIEDGFHCVLAHMPGPIVLYDAPLFFEVGLHERFQRSIVVTVPSDVQRDRIRKRDPDLSEADIEARIRVQMPLLQKEGLATWLVRNDGTREQTHVQVTRIGELLDDLARHA